MVPTVLLLTAAVGGAAWMAARLLHQPDVPTSVPSAAESRLAQQKLLEVLRRPQRLRGPAAETVTFTEHEVNTLVSSHLVQVRRVAVKNVFIRLVDATRVDINGSLPLGDVLEAGGLAVINRLLPAGGAARPVWWRFATRPRAAPDSEGRRWLYLDVEGLILGDQPVPVTLARLLVPPSMFDMWRLELPNGVHSVTVDRGRVVVHLRGSP